MPGLNLLNFETHPRTTRIACLGGEWMNTELAARASNTEGMRGVVVSYLSQLLLRLPLLLLECPPHHRALAIEAVLQVRYAPT